MGGNLFLYAGMTLAGFTLFMNPVSWLLYIVLVALVLILSEGRVNVLTYIVTIVIAPVLSMLAPTNPEIHHALGGFMILLITPWILEK